MFFITFTLFYLLKEPKFQKGLDIEFILQKSLQILHFMTPTFTVIYNFVYLYFLFKSLINLFQFCHENNLSNIIQNYATFKINIVESVDTNKNLRGVAVLERPLKMFY